jgi:hypothetical protein
MSDHPLASACACEHSTVSPIALQTYGCVYTVFFFDIYRPIHLSPLWVPLRLMQGYMVVAGSLLVKLPQIIRILKKESAEGISLFGAVARQPALA